MGVAHLPVGVVVLGKREAEFGGFFVKVTAFRRCGFVGAGHPLGGIAEHIVEVPGVGFEGSDWMCGVVGVVPVPGDFVLFVWCFIEPSGGGVLPFGFSRQPELLAGFLGEPCAECYGGLGVNPDGGIAFVSITSVGCAVRFGGSGPDDFVFGGVFLAEIKAVGEDIVDVPGDFGLSDPDGLDWGFFAVFPVGSSGDADHFVFGEVALDFDDHGIGGLHGGNDCQESGEDHGFIVA